MKQIRVALLGFGNVGRAFAEYSRKSGAGVLARLSIRAVADSSGGLALNADDELDQILAHKAHDRSLAEFSPATIIADPAQFIASLSASGVSLLVESLPTNINSGQPALDLITFALSAGLNVVTVNKGPLVYGFDELRKAAGTGGSRLAYSGTTGVKIPDELRGEPVLEIAGVLNGTCNYILTQMQELGLPFDQALAEAQADGIAEPDPLQDIEGWDSAAKLLILAKSLMDADLAFSDILTRGINADTEGLIKTALTSGKAVRLVGRAREHDGRLRLTVAPEMIAADSPFFPVRGTSKLAVFKTGTRGIVASSHSGRDAISQTIVDDIVRVLPAT
jgi:homoserine dehydrogenase